MPARKTSPTKSSRGKTSTRESPGGSPKSGQRLSRAQRDDTPEALRQRERIAKTHPTRAQQTGPVRAARKNNGPARPATGRKVPAPSARGRGG